MARGGAFEAVAGEDLDSGVDEAVGGGGGGGGFCFGVGHGGRGFDVEFSGRIRQAGGLSQADNSKELFACSTGEILKPAKMNARILADESFPDG